MSNIKFLYGNKQNFNDLSEKDNDTLYFITDTLQLFKGTNEYTKSCKMVSSLPTTNQIQGIIYINITDFTLHAFNGTDFVQLTKNCASSISASPSNNSVPTEKAVADYVTSKISDLINSGGNFVTDVTYTPSSGTLEVEKGGVPTTTVLTGIVNAPTYDSNTRTITLPVFGGDSLVIALGKDAFVKSGSYNELNKTIDLVLTSDDKVSIPVGSLVDIYTGIATSTTTTSVSADNKISVSVKVSATANNAITLENDGLYVPLPDAYTKIQIDEKVTTITDSLNTHANNSDIHVTAAQTSNWDSKATVAQITTAKSEAITAAATDATTKANSALSEAKSYTNSALTWAEIK